MENAVSPPAPWECSGLKTILILRKETRMKKQAGLFSTFIPAVSLAAAVMLLCFCQKSRMERKSAETAGPAAPDSASWFTVQTVAEGVRRVDDHGGDNIYLVEGKDTALVIDTGTGTADLAAYIRSLTPLPVTVVNTHGHPDHGGGNFQFETVHLHEADLGLLKNFTGEDYRRGTIKRALEQNPEMKSRILDEKAEIRQTRLVPVKAGQVFDLSGRTLEVIETPGHTAGSICLLDPGHRLLFTGDNNNILVWLFLDHCLPLEKYYETLKNLRLRAGEFDTILPGHGTPIDTAFLDEQIECVKQILDGSCKDEPYQSFAGDARVCRYKRASVAFNPANLRASP